MDSLPGAVEAPTPEVVVDGLPAEALTAVIKALASADSAGDAHGARSLYDSSIVDDVPGGVSTTERDKDMPKIDGPYTHGKRFRIRVRERGKPAKVISFTTEIDAKAEARRL
ncbi:MAG: hypothetical protein ACLP66_22720 [Polyangia bacterium]|jgi:hypothetical protein